MILHSFGWCLGFVFGVCLGCIGEHLFFYQMYDTIRPEVKITSEKKISTTFKSFANLDEIPYLMAVWTDCENELFGAVVLKKFLTKTP